MEWTTFAGGIVIGLALAGMIIIGVSLAWAAGRPMPKPNQRKGHLAERNGRTYHG
jgi:hypothetical protein